MKIKKTRYKCISVSEAKNMATSSSPGLLLSNLGSLPRLGNAADAFLFAVAKLNTYPRDTQTH